MLNGHVGLDLRCLDRVYLNGYLARLQVGGQVAQFLRHRGFRCPRRRACSRSATRSAGSVTSYADANHIPVVQVEVHQPQHLPEFHWRLGRSPVAAIGVAHEPQRVFIARQRDTDPPIPPQFSFDK